MTKKLIAVVVLLVLVTSLSGWAAKQNISISIFDFGMERRGFRDKLFVSFGITAEDSTFASVITSVSLRSALYAYRKRPDSDPQIFDKENLISGESLDVSVETPKSQFFVKNIDFFIMEGICDKADVTFAEEYRGFSGPQGPADGHFIEIEVVANTLSITEEEPLQGEGIYTSTFRFELDLQGSCSSTDAEE